MSNQVYPAKVRGLTWSVGKSPEGATSVQTARDQSEVRISLMYNPIWHFELVYNYLKNDPAGIQAGMSYTDFQTFLGFVLSLLGQYDDFLFDDPADDWSGPALLAGPVPNPNATLPLVTDGVTYFSPLQRRVANVFAEDITDLNPDAISTGGAGTSPLRVYANGVLKTLGADYTIQGPKLTGPGYSYLGRYLQWTAMPAAPITAEFGFYFRMRMESDRQDFAQFMQFLYGAGGNNGSTSSSIKLRTSRTPSL